MLLLRDEAAWRRTWGYKDHGKDWDAVYNREHPPGFRWLHEAFGTNWRMTEMQAAIGRIQLAKLPDWLARRRRNAALLTQRLTDLPALRIPQPPDNIGHAYYKYYAFVRPERLSPGWTRDRIAQAIQAQGIPCTHGSCSDVPPKCDTSDSGIPADLFRRNKKFFEERILLRQLDFRPIAVDRFQQAF